MDQLLKPNLLEMDPNAPGAAAEFELWHYQFENFLAATKLATTDDDKKRLLGSRVGTCAYAIIREATSYTESIRFLKAQYLRNENEVHARHLLRCRRQAPGESHGQFLRALLELSRACNCRQTTANQFRDIIVLDAYITGTRSQEVRQKLLQQDALDLATAFKLAESL